MTHHVISDNHNAHHIYQIG